MKGVWVVHDSALMHFMEKFTTGRGGYRQIGPRSIHDIHFLPVLCLNMSISN